MCQVSASNAVAMAVALIAYGPLRVQGLTRRAGYRPGSACDFSNLTAVAAADREFIGIRRWRCRGDNGTGISGQFRTTVPFRTLPGRGRPRAEQQASRKDVRCEELVDEAALDRARSDHVQPELRRPPLGREP